jgi:hypothetical protein
MTAITAFLAKPAVKYGALVLAVLAIAGFIYLKGERAGSSGVINAVQSESLKKLDAARKSKERTDEEVRRTPYDDRVDGLR